MKLSGIIKSDTIEDLYEVLVSNYPNPCFQKGAGSLPDKFHWRSNSVKGQVEIMKMIELDFLYYLPDDVLVKLDRACMAVGLESRVPFLDHKVIEFAREVPIDLKLRDGQGKWIMRKLLERYIPSEMLNRPKSGFSVPIGKWLTSDLLNWADGLITEYQRNPYCMHDKSRLEKVWSEHRKGRADYQHIIWPILGYQSWYNSI